MVEQRNRLAATADNADEFEWVNAWAAQARRAAIAPAGDRRSVVAMPCPGAKPDLAVVAGTDVAAAQLPADFEHDVVLAGDIIDIAEARDALNAAASPPTPETPVPRLVWLPIGLGRTADSVPIILGSVLGFLMVLVFTTAAVFVKLAR